MKNLQKRSIYITVIFLVCIIFTESFLRLIYPYSMAPDFFYPSNFRTSYELKGDYQGSYYHGNSKVTVSINQKGKRVFKNSKKKRQEHIVHLVGDSQVFGWGLNDDETISFFLDSLGGDSFTIINHGVPGYGPFAYKEILNEIPFSDTVVMLFSEQNDSWDAYSAKATVSSKCGFLVPETTFGKIVPCWLLRMRLFQLTALVLNSSKSNKRALPLEYNPYTKISSKVLEYRINSLFDTDVAIRRNELIIGIVPWDAAIISDRLCWYLPRISRAENFIQLRDDLRISEHFNNISKKELLFQTNDNHISAEGAKCIAQIIFDRLSNGR
jgi:hypothetical protein